MSGRAGCWCMLRLVMAKDSGYLELQRSELRHHAASHAQDDSKKLKYEQMVAIRDAVVTALQLSAAMLRRNMQMRDSSTKTIPAEHMHSTSTVPAKSCVPNNSRALTWMTLTASCKSLQTATCDQRWCAGTTILKMVTTLASTTFA